MDNEQIKNHDENQHKFKPDEKILEYINKAIKKGFSKDDVVKALASAGYDANLAEQHFNHAVKKNAIKKIFIYTLAVLFLITILTAALFFYLSKPKTADLRWDGEYSSELIVDFQLDPEYNKIIRTSYEKGRRYFAQQDWDNSIKEFENLVELSPMSQGFHYFLGAAHCNKGNYDTAIIHYQEAIRLNRLNPVFYFGMARCFERQGLHEKAVEALNKSLYINLN